MLAVACVAMLCAVVPAALFCVNLTLYRPPPRATVAPPFLSVLIPARNEAASIGAAMASALANSGVAFEVVVMDDASTDDTAAIVQALADSDVRVRLAQAPPLPFGWNGKQHACWALAQAAKGDLFCFVDADVRLATDALSRMAAFLVQSNAALVSGFPHLVTETWIEWLLLPLIHFVLLGFLPIAWMRKGTDPSFAAGCGQFMMVRREAYFAAGGHAAIRQTMHDGLLLPRRLRQAAFRTDLADLTHLAECRMYTNAREVWQGLAKNATEGIAAPVRIVPISLLLMFGQVLPFGLAAWLLLRGGASAAIVWLVAIAAVAAWLPRALAVRRFRQDWRGAWLHPLGMVLLLAIQWYALARQIAGGKVSWKQRAYM